MKLKHALAAGVAASLILAGCSSPADTDQPDDATDPAAEGQDATIGLISFSGTDPSANITLATSMEWAEANGYEVVLVDANGQVDQANTAMQNLVQRGVAGIVVTVFPVDALGAGLAATKEAGIPVVTSGGGVGDGVAVNVDDSQGEVVTEQLIADAASDGEVLTLTYLGGRPCQLRLASFDETVAAEAPDLNITRQAITVPGQVESATSATLAWLAAHPEGSASSLSIYACFDDPALGAIAALTQTNRTDVKVYGFNGIVPALDAVRDGTLSGTLWFDQGAIGTKLMEVLDGAIKGGIPETSEEVAAPSVLVTPDNYESFVAEHPEVLEEG